MKEKFFGYFNHRILRGEYGVLSVHTVYYDKKGVPTDYVKFEGSSDKESLYIGVIESLEAFARPILDISDIDVSRSTLEAANAYGAGAIHQKMEEF
jgi:hypothetical protein